MSNHIEHEWQAYIADFDKANALLCNYASACSHIAILIRERAFEKDAKLWLRAVDNYREKHREMLNVYRGLPSEGILEYMAGEEAVAAYYGELTKGKHCKDCMHHQCSEIGVDRCYFTYPPYDTEAHKQACRCFKPKEGDEA